MYKLKNYNTYILILILSHTGIAKIAFARSNSAPLDMLIQYVVPNDSRTPGSVRASTPKIPFILNADCFIVPGEHQCIVEFLKRENFPEDTNLAVIEQVSVHMFSDDDTEQFSFSFSAYFQGNEYQYALPDDNYGLEQTSGFQFRHNEIVHIYHDGCINKDCSELNGIEVNFGFSNGPILRSPIGQHFYIAGYYTYVEQLDTN